MKNNAREAVRGEHVRKRRIGRKALSSEQMVHSIERRMEKPAPVAKKKLHIRLPKIHYTYRRWHAFALLGIVAVTIIASFVVYQVHEQSLAQQREEQAKAEKAAIEAQKKRQACMADVTSKKNTQLGKVTYDQLYDGLCN